MRSSQDITERGQAAEAELEQARRLESVGQLAGGVAHEFNNIFAVIMNFAEFTAAKIGERSPAFQHVEKIRQAAERGVALTRQLLIIGGRASSVPEVLDLNTFVSSLENLLERSLGEHVQLETRLGSGLSPVEADPAQLEQVLINLAMNSRDAMPRGGRFTVETANMEIDDEFALMHPNTTPGPHVRLTVSDTGVGMESEVAARAFEPFFSTKRGGKGTGLGLATVYSMVRQAGGAIQLHSSTGRGTTVEIYLPAVSAAPTEARAEIERSA